jgi:hypothetical protein
MAYYRIEPFGEIVADHRHGIATSVLANINRDSKRKPDAYTAEDFIPWHRSDQSNDKPMLLDDPEEQSKLIKKMLFKHG